MTQDRSIAVVMTAAVLLVGLTVSLPQVYADSTTASGAFYGVVSDTAARPLRAIFVQARHLQSGMGITVLTDTQGRYRIEGLAEGEYALLLDWQIDDLAKQEIKGLRVTPQGHRIEAGERKTVDFTLEMRPPAWTELSMVQYRSLLPEQPGRAESFMGCANCHGFRWQSLHPRNDIVWGDTVDWITRAFSYHFDRGPYKGFVTPEVRDSIAAYLASVFGPDAKLPPQPPVPRRTISDEALDIVYVDYPMPTLRSFPWAAVEDSNGNIWIPQYATNQIARLNPVSGNIDEFRVPGRQRAALQSIVPVAEDTVWIAAPGMNQLIRFNPQTRTFNSYRPEENDVYSIGQFPHGLAVDAKGQVWAAGGNLIARFDPVSETFHYYGDAPREWDSYSLQVDQEDNVWFGRTNHHRYGRIDAGSDRLEEHDSPTVKGGSRQIAIDAEGNAWFGEWNSAEVFRVDAGTGKTRRYPIPGDYPKPDAIGVDAEDQVWYYAWGQSELGRLDPKTGKVVVYPVPYVDSTMRTFSRDRKGRLWFGAPPANRVGYFYLR